MPRRPLKSYLPTPSELRQNKLLSPVAHLLNNPELWHMNRRSVAGAVFIGLFSAWIPIPSQMVLSAILAIFFRCNLPIAIVLVWITNPITIPPMFYFAYRLGAWLLDMQISVGSIDLSASWIWNNLGSIGYPLLFGSFVCAWVSGVSGFVITRVVWRWKVIRRWRARRKARRARKLALKHQTSERKISNRQTSNRESSNPETPDHEHSDHQSGDTQRPNGVSG